MYSLGGKGEMHDIAQFFKASSLKKKIRSIAWMLGIMIIIWILGRVEKIPKKSLKKCFKNSILYKYQSVTHVSTSIVQGLFKNIVFRSVALVIKKLWAFLGFFLHRPDFTDMYPTLCMKNLNP